MLFRRIQIHTPSSARVYTVIGVLSVHRRSALRYMFLQCLQIEAQNRQCSMPDVIEHGAICGSCTRHLDPSYCAQAHEFTVCTHAFIDACAAERTLILTSTRSMHKIDNVILPASSSSVSHVNHAHAIVNPRNLHRDSARGRRRDGRSRSVQHDDVRNYAGSNSKSSNSYSIRPRNHSRRFAGLWMWGADTWRNSVRRRPHCPLLRVRPPPWELDPMARSIPRPRATRPRPAC